MLNKKHLIKIFKHTHNSGTIVNIDSFKANNDKKYETANNLPQEFIKGVNFAAIISEITKLSYPNIGESRANVSLIL